MKTNLFQPPLIESLPSANPVYTHFKYRWQILDITISQQEQKHGHTTYSSSKNNLRGKNEDMNIPGKIIFIAPLQISCLVYKF